MFDGLIVALLNLSHENTFMGDDFFIIRSPVLILVSGLIFHNFS